ncbi:hypothetical protein LCM02_04830 [Lutimonas saemankumensis]|uniref:DUF6090 family protein n=1 Tax=Lutimonas saemankumensis TaxID=483016 RepID=UPI001CD7C191|nr:DUF6090 family protein [Lutimonas saemankumensis]MCA0931766.1 hypothetical protein [Lutimonas saemankumensis]
MIPFFRKIRKKMADDNRPLKYARYAIGEIILVVIGILIALQINNWNEEQKTRVIEIKTLKEIRANLPLDLIEINQDIAVMDSITHSGTAVLNYLNNNDKPSETFKYNIHVSRLNPHFDAVQGSYSLLQSKGLDIISNDSLRGAISKLYELSYPYYAKYETERIFKINNIILPKYTEYFSFIWNGSETFYSGTSEISEKGFFAMKNDITFINVLNLALNENEGVKDRAYRTAGNIQDLIDFIDAELKGK